MATTQYVGARYVSLFPEDEQWDSSKQYEPLTVVLHNGNSYTSKQYVPEGIDVADKRFWALTGNYNAQVEQYRKETAIISEKEEKNAASISGIKTVLTNEYRIFKNVLNNGVTVGTDCTQAVQDIIDSTDTQDICLYFPAGTYNFTGTVTVPVDKNLFVRGEIPSNEIGLNRGAESTVAMVTGTVLTVSGLKSFKPLFQTQQGADGSFKSTICSIENVTVINGSLNEDGTYEPLKKAMLVAPKSYTKEYRGNVFLTECFIAGFVTVAGVVGELAGVIAHRCRFTDCTYGFMNLQDSRITDCAFNRCDTAIAFSSLSGFTSVIGCRIEWCKNSGITYTGTAHDVIVGNCEFDRCGLYAIQASGGTNLTVTGNTFRRNCATATSATAHLSLINVKDAVLTGNNTIKGNTQDDGSGTTVPERAQIFQNCTRLVDTGNSWEGATSPKFAMFYNNYTNIDANATVDMFNCAVHVKPTVTTDITVSLSTDTGASSPNNGAFFIVCNAGSGTLKFLTKTVAAKTWQYIIYDGSAWVTMMQGTVS